MNNKPITLIREDFINNLSNVVNTCELPMFVVEDILRQFTTEVSLLAKQQIEIDRRNYEAGLQTERHKKDDIEVTGANEE